jgi:hypothetical protein
MTQRPRVYIAGPISSDPLTHLRVGLSKWHELWDLGYAPFLPHLTAYLEVAKSLPYEEWIEYDFRWLDVCDAVLRLSGGSPGADREVARATAAGVPVAFTVQELLHLCPRS